MEPDVLSGWTGENVRRSTIWLTALLEQDPQSHLNLARAADGFVRDTQA